MPELHIRSALQRFERGQGILIVCHNASEVEQTINDLIIGSTRVLRRDGSQVYRPAGPRTDTREGATIYVHQISDVPALRRCRSFVEHVFFPVVVGGRRGVEYIDMDEHEFYSTYVDATKPVKKGRPPKSAKEEAPDPRVDAFDVLKGEDLI